MIPKMEFPRPDRQRGDWLNLNGQWEFKLLPDGVGSDAPEGFDRQITVPFSWVSPLSGVAENVKGVGWYRRTVSFPVRGRLFLCFGAVDYISDVYVNGKHLCHHQGGYNPFEMEVTEIWQDGENEIVVRAEDDQKENQTYGKQGYGEIQGIWQTVWLENRGPEYIDSFRFYTKISGDVTLRVKACAADGAKVTAVFDGKEFSGAVENGGAEIAMHFDDTRLWSPECPE